MSSVRLPRMLEMRAMICRKSPLTHRSPANSATHAHILLRSSLQQVRQQSSHVASSPARSHRLRNFFLISAFGAGCAAFGFSIGAVPVAGSILALMTAPSSEDALRMYDSPSEIASKIEEHLQNHPLVKELRDKSKWEVLRPHLNMSETVRKHNLTGGTLLGPNLFPVPPLTLCTEKESVSVMYVGSDLCGHAGIVHGGLIATVLDEGLAWCAFGSLPNKLGVTAFLNINYRKPVPAGSYLLLRAETTRSEGRKVWVKGTISMLGEDSKRSEPLVEAEALYVEPKWVKWMPRIFQGTVR